MAAVSVIVPLYECRPYIAATLDSILAQTYTDFEVIVVDDGSADGGGAVVEEYAARDARIVYLRQENRGSSAARNTAIAAARAEYVAFLDADDLWLPDKLARQLPLMCDDTVVHGNCLVIREGEPGGGESVGSLVDPLAGVDPFGRLLESNAISVLTVIVPRALLLAHGCFDTTLRSAEDYDLWLRLSVAGVRFAHVLEPLAVYRVRLGSLSSDPVSMASCRLAVFRKLKKSVDPARRRAVRRRIGREQQLLSGELRRRGRRSLCAGRVREGRRDLVEAVRAAPGWWRNWPLALALVSPVGLRRLAVWTGRRDTTAPGR